MRNDSNNAFNDSHESYDDDYVVIDDDDDDDDDNEDDDNEDDANDVKWWGAIWWDINQSNITVRFCFTVQFSPNTSSEHVLNMTGSAIVGSFMHRMMPNGRSWQQTMPNVTFHIEHTITIV